MADSDHVVYLFNCPNNGCKAIDNSYVGFTTNTLRIRSEQHNNNGAIRKHFESKHGIRPTTEQILQNMRIIEKSNSKNELMLLEAL